MNTGYNTIASSDFGKIDSSAQSSVGAISTTEDSRHFRYVKFANAAEINAGAEVYAAPTTVAATVTSVGTAGQVAENLVAGSKKFVATLGAAVTAKQLDGGFVKVTDATGTYNLRVKSVQAGASGVNSVVELLDFIPDGLNLATATALSFTSNPYVVSATTGTGTALGTTVNQIPAQAAGEAVYAYVQVA